MATNSSSNTFTMRVKQGRVPNTFNDEKAPKTLYKAGEFIKQHSVYYGKCIEHQANARKWQACGQYKMASEETKRALCLFKETDGGLRAYNNYIPSEQLWVRTKRL